MLVLLVSVGALLLASAGLARHILRAHARRKSRPGIATPGASNIREVDVEKEETP
jgi:hypothetical protein